MIKISNICLHQNSIFIKFLKILKIHEIFCENTRIIFVLFYDVHKENMFTINLEDGRDALSKASIVHLFTKQNMYYKFFGFYIFFGFILLFLSFLLDTNLLIMPVLSNIIENMIIDFDYDDKICFKNQTSYLQSG